VEGFIPSSRRSRLERPEDAWIVPGPNHSEHIGAFSIAPPSTGPRAFAHAAIGPSGSHRSVSQTPPRRDAGLTAPEAAFHTSPGTLPWTVSFFHLAFVAVAQELDTSAFDSEAVIFVWNDGIVL